MALTTKAELLLVSVAAGALLTSPALAQTVPPSTLAITPYDVSTPLATLVSAVQAANSGITVLSSSYIGITGQGGTYTGFNLPSTNGGPTITAPNGVLLTSGSADLPLTNTLSAFSHTTDTGSNAQLTALLNGVPTNDQNVLSLTFTVNNPAVNAVKAGFVFGTDEYPEYIAQYNDTMGFFVDGKNYAFFPGGSLVSINSSTLSNFNNNNVQSTVGTPPYGIEYDGISNLLNVDGLLDPTLTTHTLTIAIADVNDTAVDSGVFFGGLQAASVSGGGGIVPTAPTIDTTSGDIAPDVFSLGSPAAQATTVEFDGGTLRLTGGTFAGNIITAPVTISASNGTVDTAPASGGFSGVVSGPGSLTIIGGNTFSLTGANTYAGGTQLQGGTLLVGSDSALGTGTLTMADGTTLKENVGVTLGNTAIISGTATFETSDTTASGEGLIYNGVISGTGTLVKTGASGLRLTAANTYSGGTVIEAGHIGISNNDALGTGTLTFAGGSLRPHVDGLTISNAAVLASDGTISTRGHDLTYAGAISGAGQLIKTGEATLTLSNANTYTGGTVLTAGTLLVSTSTSSSAGVTSSSIGSGLLTFDGATLQALQGTVVSFDNAVQVTGNGGTIDSNGGSLRLSGVIAGSGALHYVATGGVFTGEALDATSIILRGSNTYTGGSTVGNGAAVQAVAANALGLGSLEIAQGGVVSLSGFDQHVTTLTGSGLIFGSGALDGAQNSVTIETLTAQSGSFSGQIENGNHFIGNDAGGTTIVDYGDITLRKVSDGSPSGGTLLLSGTNSYGQYGGQTLLEGGTIAVASNSALGTSTLAMSDGTTLQLAASSVGLQNDITLSGTDTVDTQDNAGGLGFHGVISGTGTLVKIGSTGLGLYNANLYSGGTLLDAGRITLHNSAGLGTGALTFNGGLLRAGVDGLTVGNAATLATDGTIDTQTFALTYAGSISGVGQLIKLGTGTLALTNANSYTGGTTLNAGTLGVGNGSAIGSGPLTVNGGTVQAAANGITLGNAVTLAAPGVLDTQTFALTMSGAIAGPGQLSKIGTGTLTLTGSSTYAGGTEVLAGTLEVGNSAALGTGPVGLDDGTELRFVADGLTLANAIALRNTDPTIDTGSGFETISGPISGPGALTKIGSGTLDLTGTDTYTGATEVAGGTLLVDGAVASAVTVDSGASLGGHGSIASVIVGSGGVLAPSAAQALTISGNLQLLTGATYQVTVNADGTNGKLAVGGTADLGGATLSVLAGSGTFKAGSYTLLTAGTLLPGTTFGTVTTATTLALLRPQVSYDYAANDVSLTLNPVAFKSIATTANQAGVAGAIQNLGEGNGLYDAVVGLDAAQARQAFNATSGVTHANTQAVITNFARTGTTLLLDRLWDVSGSGLSAQQVLNQFAPDRMPALVRCYGPTPDPVPVPPPPTYTAWGEAFGTFGHTNGNPNAGALDRSLGGFILGIDTPLDRIGGDKWRAGIAGGYTNTSFKSPLDGGSGTVQNVFGSLYGGARYGAVDVRLGTVAGGTFVDARRDVAFGGAPLFSEIERSHNTGYTVQTFGEVGYRIPAGTIVIEPIAGAAYLHSHQDGFTEKGGVAALTVAAQDTDLGTTTLGVRAEAQPFKNLPIVAHALLGWQHAIGDVSPATTLAFASAPLDTFSVAGTPIDRDALAAEAALDYRVSSLLDIGLTYVGQIGATASDHSVKGRVEYRF